MKAIILSTIYLLIATSTVKSASYYYRAGREIIVPSVDEPIKEVIAELKKDSPVAVEALFVEKVPDSVVVPENNVVDSVPQEVVKAAVASVNFFSFCSNI